MNDLTAYVIKHYGRFMTRTEGMVYKALILDLKEGEPAKTLIERLRRDWGAEDSMVIAMLDQGADGFMNAVRDRILGDHADEVVVNRCPKCDVLTSTPRGKQCLECGHDWRH